MSNVLANSREAIRVKVKKCEPNLQPEWRKFSVDPEITSIEVLYSLLAKAFEIKSDFSIKYKTYDRAGNEIYLAVSSDWDLNTAFQRIHNISIQTATEPYLMLQIDIKPFTEVKKWDPDIACSLSESSAASNCAHVNLTGSTNREVLSPLQQSFGVSQKYMQQMQTKLPGMIMNQMEKTFSMMQKAFNMNEETMVALPPRLPLADDEFLLFLDALGQIQRCEELRKVIFFGGIDPSLRRVVWKHILNVYPSVMSGNQRMDYMRRKSEQYYKLRDTWKTAIRKGYVVGELAYVTSMVRKDVLRTDRLHPFYAGSDDNQNIAALFNILTTYALNHPSISYCQGMSDIASPLLVTMNDEAQAYICFCAIMNRLRGNFMLDGIAMTQKFSHLSEALSYYDAEFWDYLKAQQADDLLFCYRWLLLELKREFPFEDALRMLEVQWSSLKCENSGDREELKLYEKEYVPKMESPVAIGAEVNISPTSSFICENDAIHPYPSYIIAKPRENTYTKLCVLRRQSSSVSLNSISSLTSANTNYKSVDVQNLKLHVTKRLNQSLDENIIRHATRRQHKISSKSNHSLDEVKRPETGTKNCDSYIYNHCNNVIADAFNQTKGSDFHDTNPFKSAENTIFINTCKENQIPQTFLSSSSSSLQEDENILCTASTCGHNETFNDLACDYTNGYSSSANTKCKISKEAANSQHQNIPSNYNTASTIVANKLTANLSENLKHVSNTGGGHFKDLKEKIAAKSRKGLILEDSNQNSKQKLVKNFNEFLNFKSINKNRISNTDNLNDTKMSSDEISAIRNISKTPSPTHNQAHHCSSELTKKGYASSLDSDSSSLPDTTNNTWSCSTAATAIQQANSSSSYSLQLELNSQYSSLNHTPEKTPVAEHQINQYTSKVSFQHDKDAAAVPDDNPYLDNFPMTTNIHPQLQLSVENLDGQSSGDCVLGEKVDRNKGCISSEIEYKKLDRGYFDMAENFKEKESTALFEVRELMQKQCHRYKSLFIKTEDNMSKLIVNGKIDSNLYLNDGGKKENQTIQNAFDGAFKCNPFLDKNLLTKEILQAKQISKDVNSCVNLGDLARNSVSLPEVLVPVSSTVTPDTIAIDEMATTAAEEASYSAKETKIPGTKTNTFTFMPRLPPPSEFGGGNPFLMFLCLTLLLQHRNTIIKSNMDYNEIAMHFDKMVRKHDVTRVLNQARQMYIDYLKSQTTYNPQKKQKSMNLISGKQQPKSDLNRNATALSSQQEHSKHDHHCNRNTSTKNS